MSLSMWACTPTERTTCPALLSAKLTSCSVPATASAWSVTPAAGLGKGLRLGEATAITGARMGKEHLRPQRHERLGLEC